MMCLQKQQQRKNARTNETKLSHRLPIRNIFDLEIKCLFSHNCNADVFFLPGMEHAMEYDGSAMDRLYL